MAAPEHLNVVALQTCFVPVPQTFTLPPGYTFTLNKYYNTTPEETLERIKDAHILLTTIVRLDAHALSAEATPNLRLISVGASGTDTVDLAACAKRGIRVLNSPNCNNETVAEHALALYLAARRAIPTTMRELNKGSWPGRGTLTGMANQAGRPPRACSQETAAIIGYGVVGQTVGKLLGALGMKIIAAGRKGASGPPPEGRVSFEDAIKTATVVVLCCPLSPETEGLISSPEFALMREDAVVVNVARGGVVDEAALVAALKEGKIAGAGVDVFAKEPATPETCPLLGTDTEGLNLVTTPHTAWLGGATVDNYQRVLQENVNGFLLGKIAEDRIKV